MDENPPKFDLERAQDVARLKDPELELVLRADVEKTVQMPLSRIVTFGDPI